MPQLNAAGLQAVTTNFRLLFSMGANNAKPKYDDFFTELTSTGSSTKVVVSGGLPGLREWIGERQAKQLLAYMQELENSNYELTIEVEKNHYDDDELGMYRGEVMAMGMQAKLDSDKRSANLLINGFTDKGVDNVAFFSDAHPVGQSGDTQSNKGTAALDATAFEAGMAAMRVLKNAAGEPVDPFDYGAQAYLVVPPQLESMADSIVSVRTLAAGGENPNYNKAKVIVDGRLSGHATKWFILLGGEGSMLRPLVRVTRKKPELISLTRPDDESVFNERKLKWGVDYRGKVGYGAYHAAYGSTGTT